jgi:hypothetical protein
MFSISYITTDKRQTFFVVFIVAFIANISKEKSGVIPNKEMATPFLYLKNLTGSVF